MVENKSHYSNGFLSKRRRSYGNLVFLIFILSGLSIIFIACRGSELITDNNTEEISSMQKVTGTSEPLKPASTPVSDTLYPPVIKSTYPAQNEVVSPDIDVIITFTEAMDTASVEESLILQPVIDGRTAFDWENERTLRIHCEPQCFDQDMEYFLQITKNARSQRGMNLSNAFHLNFWTFPSLGVLQTYPEVDSTATSADFSLQLVFNQPVVDTACVDATNDEKTANCPVDIIDLSPDILGEGKWIDEAIYEFTPYHYWKAGASYVVHLKSDSENDLFDPRSIQDWSFTVAPPQIIDVFPPNNQRNVRLDTDIHIWFNTPMDEKVSGSSLSVKTKDGAYIPGIVSWQDKGRHMLFTPEVPLKYGTLYIVTLGPRARALSSTPLENPRQWQYITVPYPVVDAIEPADSAISVAINAPIRIKFNGDFDEESLLSNVTITPEFTYQQVTFNHENKTLLVSGDLDIRTEYCVYIAGELTDIYGTPISESVESCFTTGDILPDFSLVNGMKSQVVSGDQPATLYFSNTNTTEVDFSLYRLGVSQYVEKELVPENVIHTWREQFSYIPNQTQVDAVSLLSSQASLPLGCYGLVWKADNQATVTSTVAVVDLYIILKASVEEVVAWVIDLGSGMPVSQTAVSFYDASGELIAAGTTKENGLIRVPVQKQENLLDVMTAVAGEPGMKGFGVAQTDWNSSLGDHFNIPTYLGPFPTYMGRIWVDKQFYLPGEKVKYFGFIYENIENKYVFTHSQPPLVLRLVDENEQVIYESVIDASPSGLINGSIPLDMILSEGIYTVTIQHDSMPDHILSNSTLTVTTEADIQYILSVQAGTPHDNHSEQYSFYMNLSDLYGNVLGEKELEWLLFEDRKNHTGLNSGPIVVDSGKVKTDEYGHASLVLSSPFSSFADNNHTTEALWYLQVIYTDETGVTVSDETEILMRTRDLFFDIQSRANYIHQNERLIIDVTLFEHPGMPIAGQAITLTFDDVGQLSDVHGDDSVFSVDDVEKILVVETDNTGQATAIYEPETSGSHHITAYMTDSSGYLHKTVEKVWVIGSELIKTNANSHIFVPISDKDKYEIGDTAYIYLPVKTEKPFELLVTLENGEILHIETVSVESGNYIHTLPIEESYGSVVYASFTAIIKTDGEEIETQTGYVALEITQPKDKLDIQIVTDQKYYRSGDQAHVRIRVKDSEGLPVDAEVFFILEREGISNQSISSDIVALHRQSMPMQVLTGHSLFVSTNTTSLFASSRPIEFNTELSDHINEVEWKTSPHPIIVRYIPFSAASEEIIVPVDLSHTSHNLQVTVAAITREAVMGINQAELAVSSTLTIAPIFPDYFTNDDFTDCAAIIKNLTETSQNITVTIHTIDAIELVDTRPFIQVQIPPYSQRRVVWPVHIVQNSSKNATYAFTIADENGQIEEIREQRVDVEILPLTSNESIVTTGFLSEEDSITDVIWVPEIADTATTLTLYAETDIEAMFDAGLSYVFSYPVERTEVVASRLMTSLVYESLVKSQPFAITDRVFESDIKRYISLILARQNVDGGWSSWKSDSQLTTTAYTTMVLVHALRNGYLMPQEAINAALEYIVSSFSLEANDGKTDATMAFCLYILSYADYPWPINVASRLYSMREALGVSGKAYLLLAFAGQDLADTRIETLRKEIENAAITSGNGHLYWRDGKSSLDYTDIETTALVLIMRQVLDYEDRLSLPIVKWLMTQRNGKDWPSPFTTAIALHALSTFYREMGLSEPTFDMSLHLNTHEVYDCSTGPAASDVVSGIFTLNDNFHGYFGKGKNIIEFSRGPGLGMLYYASILESSLLASDYIPSSRGLIVSRDYCNYELDDRHQLLYQECCSIDKVTRDDVVEVRISIYVPVNHKDIEVIDRLPAGFVPFASLNQENIIHNVAFTQLYCIEEQCVIWGEAIPAGVHQFSYFVKAMRTGVYNALPIVARIHSYPEFWAESDINKIIILEK